MRRMYSDRPASSPYSSYTRRIQTLILFAVVLLGTYCPCNTDMVQEHSSLVKSGFRIEVFQGPNVLFNEIYEMPDGDVIGVSARSITTLSSHFQVEESKSIAWDLSTKRRTWAYSPHLVFAGQETYLFGKYRIGGNPRDEYLFVSSYKEPSKKISLDICQKTKYGWRGGYCGQFDNLAKADFWGNGTEQMIVNELPLEPTHRNSGTSRIHILNVSQIVESDSPQTLRNGIQRLETDPINYSYPLTRTVEDSKAEEVLFVAYPSSWTSKSHHVGANARGSVRLARLYGNSKSDRVEIEYLTTLQVKHKIWHLFESSKYSEVILARTLKNGKELEVRDLKGKVLNRWKLGRDFIGVERVLLYHEFPIQDCSAENSEDCFKTVVVLTNDWFSCKTSAALFAGRTDRCPTKILELHETGDWDELFEITFDEPNYAIFSAKVALDNGRAVFATYDHIYAVSLEESIEIDD